MPPTPGLLCVRSRITSDALSDSTFNDFYTNHHLPDFVSSGIADLALRYKNVDSEAKWPYLAIYRVPDSNFQSNPENMKKIRLQHEALPNGGSIMNFTELNSKMYLPLHSFEGKGQKVGRAKVLFIAEFEPAEGTDDGALREFYEKQVRKLCSRLQNPWRFSVQPLDCIFPEQQLIFLSISICLACSINTTDLLGTGQLTGRSRAMQHSTSLTLPT
jgi:hypothetical protein